MDLEEKSLQPIMEEKLVDDLAARGEIFSKSEDLILDQQAESFHPDSTNINQGSDEDPEPVVTYIDSLELYSDSTFAQVCFDIHTIVMTT
jgi:hypothetical protein